MQTNKLIVFLCSYDPYILLSKSQIDFLKRKGNQQLEGGEGKEGDLI